jgi:hypothetical protein
MNLLKVPSLKRFGNVKKIILGKLLFIQELMDMAVHFVDPALH